jgi:hypothetical protein
VWRRLLRQRRRRDRAVQTRGDGADRSLRVLIDRLVPTGQTGARDIDRGRWLIATPRSPCCDAPVSTILISVSLHDCQAAIPDVRHFFWLTVLNPFRPVRPIKATYCKYCKNKRKTYGRSDQCRSLNIGDPFICLLEGDRLPVFGVYSIVACLSWGELQPASVDGRARHGGRDEKTAGK